MLTFPFTRKKFMALTVESRHAWVIRWLSTVYQKISTNRISPQGIGFFVKEYAKVMEWCGTPPHKIPESTDTRTWLEFVSNTIHFQRMAQGLSPKDQDLLPESNLQKDRAEDDIQIPRLDFHLALDGLRSLFNVGSIFRSCDAAGFSSLILGNTQGKENATVRKTSMGTADWMPHTRTGDLAQTLMGMKDLGYTITGVETATLSKPFYETSWNHRGVVVMGNEEYGISSHVMALCDRVVHIPMFGRKNSLNVANAASIVMFHVATTLYSQKIQTSQSP